MDKNYCVCINYCLHKNMPYLVITNIILLDLYSYVVVI